MHAVLRIHGNHIRKCTKQITVTTTDVASIFSVAACAQLPVSGVETALRASNRHTHSATDTSSRRG